MSLKHLNALNLSYNSIKSIRALENLKMPLIKNIYLQNNLYIRTLQKNIDILNNIRLSSNNHYIYIMQ